MSFSPEVWNKYFMSFSLWALRTCIMVLDRFFPDFLKWTFPSLILEESAFGKKKKKKKKKRKKLCQEKNGKQCRSR